MKTNYTFPTASEVISLLELKLLVKSIITKHANIRIKCMLEGDKWGDFLSVKMVTEKGLILGDDSRNRIRSIKFIDHVVKFVIDQPFDSYNPNLAYVVS